ncbi:hypothetical protein ACFSTA_15215 [Ornithinibacillus salinisoli]|uniref:Uncharacterized protein n=1 Tax=Ornithinibacillus salinisoli TaxID=1848459 RepID=A0ABW4VZJ5_9BACI
MKKTIISVILIAFFTVGTLLAILSIDNIEESAPNTPQYSPEASADWPIYDFNTLMNEKTDLVAFITVESVEDKKVSEEKLNAKLATLKITKLLYDNRNSIDISDTILLDQAFEYVNVGESYLLFLEKKVDYYYEVDGHSKIKEINGKYQVNIEGIEGSFTQKTFEDKFTITLQEIKKE